MTVTTRSCAAVLLMMACLVQAVHANNDCFSQLSPQLQLNAPAVRVNGSLFDADLIFSATGPTPETAIWFRLTAAAASVLSGCTYPAPAFVEDSTLTVRLPVVEFNDLDLWADLAYVPSGDGQLWFKVIEFGLLGNRAFATSVSGTGDLGTWPDAGGAMGRAAGDAICQARAAAAGLPGTFVALLSDSTDDAYCRLYGSSGKRSNNCNVAELGAAGPWVRTDGHPFGASMDDLLDNGELYTPLRTDEFGNAVVSLPNLYTGSNVDGAAHAVNFPPCNDWTSSSSDDVVGGITLWTSFSWIRDASNSCDGPARLACFQVDGAAALPNFSRPGKQVFITSVAGNGRLGDWTDAGGQTQLAAGDAICQARATAAGLPNASRFKAWLSDNQTDAPDRLNSDGPWVRLDGVLVAENKAALLTTPLFATINLTETGSYLDLFGRAWTGTGINGRYTGDACGNWLVGTEMLNGTFGAPADSTSPWTNAGTLPCDFEHRLYCFED